MLSQAEIHEAALKSQQTFDLAANIESHRIQGRELAQRLLERGCVSQAHPLFGLLSALSVELEIIKRGL